MYAGVLLLQVVQLRWRPVEVAYSVERLGSYANWNGSKDGESMEMMRPLTTLSKHFMMVDVSATE